MKNLIKTIVIGLVVLVAGLGCGKNPVTVEQTFPDLILSDVQSDCDTHDDFYIWGESGPPVILHNIPFVFTGHGHLINDGVVHFIGQLKHRTTLYFNTPLPTTGRDTYIIDSDPRDINLEPLGAAWISFGVELFELFGLENMGNNNHYYCTGNISRCIEQFSVVEAPYKAELEITVTDRDGNSGTTTIEIYY